MDEGEARGFEHPEPPITPGSFQGGGGDYRLARQPPILPSSRQTKGMDGSQTECLNLARIKGLNRKLQSTGENFDELHNSERLNKTTLEMQGRRSYSFYLFRNIWCKSLNSLHHPLRLVL